MRQADGSIYVFHDATTGWSKIGLTRTGVNARLSQCRTDYPELGQAELVGFFDVDRHLEGWETIALMVVELRIRKRYGSLVGHMNGERFHGVRPKAVLKVMRWWWVYQFYTDRRIEVAFANLFERWKRTAQLP